MMNLMHFRIGPIEILVYNKGASTEIMTFSQLNKDSKDKGTKHGLYLSNIESWQTYS